MPGAFCAGVWEGFLEEVTGRVTTIKQRGEESVFWEEGSTGEKTQGGKQPSMQGNGRLFRKGVLWEADGNGSEDREGVRIQP